jgi:hypothetical protein
MEETQMPTVFADGVGRRERKVCDGGTPQMNLSSRRTNVVAVALSACPPFASTGKPGWATRLRPVMADDLSVHLLVFVDAIRVEMLNAALPQELRCNVAQALRARTWLHRSTRQLATIIGHGCGLPTPEARY